MSTLTSNMTFLLWKMIPGNMRLQFLPFSHFNHTSHFTPDGVPITKLQKNWNECGEFWELTTSDCSPWLAGSRGWILHSFIPSSPPSSLPTSLFLDLLVTYTAVSTIKSQTSEFPSCISLRKICIQNSNSLSFPAQGSGMRSSKKKCWMMLKHMRGLGRKIGLLFLTKN